MLELLKTVNGILHFKDGINIIGTIPRAIDIITLCIHPQHVEVSILVFEILHEFIWKSDEHMQLVLKALHNYKSEK